MALAISLDQREVITEAEKMRRPRRWKDACLKLTKSYPNTSPAGD